MSIKWQKDGRRYVILEVVKKAEKCIPEGIPVRLEETIREYASRFGSGELTDRQYNALLHDVRDEMCRRGL